MLKGWIEIVVRTRCVNVDLLGPTPTCVDSCDLFPIRQTCMDCIIFRRNDARTFCSQCQFQFRAGHAQAKSEDIRVAGQLLQFIDCDFVFARIAGWLEMAGDAIAQLPRMRPLPKKRPAFDRNSRNGDQQLCTIGVMAT